MLKKFLILSVGLFLTSQVNAYHANIDKKAIDYLNSVFTYNAKHNCWSYKSKDDGENHYCYNIAQAKKIISPDNKIRHYILLTANFNEFDGESPSSASSGSIAAFILEETGNNLKPLAQNLSIELGQTGQAPDNWNLVQIGPNDYWAWRTTVGYSHMGESIELCSILAPYGKTIKDICKITESSSNGGVCDEKDPACRKNQVDLSASLTLDTSNNNVKVYPFKAVISGVKKQQKINEVRVIPFNTQKWSYEEPKDYPLIN